MTTQMKGAAKKYDADKMPVYRGFLARFPRAIYAVTQVSVFGADKYEVPVENVDFLHLDGGEMRYRDAQARHILDEVLDGPLDPKDGMLPHLAQNAWDALAALERVLLEAERRGDEHFITEALQVTLSRQAKTDDMQDAPLGEAVCTLGIPAVAREDAFNPLGQDGGFPGVPGDDYDSDSGVEDFDLSPVPVVKY